MNKQNHGLLSKAYLTEGSARIERPSSTREEEIQFTLQAFLTAGDEARAQGDTVRAERFYHECIKLASREFHESIPEIALAKFHLSMLYLDRGTLVAADAFAKSALKIFIDVFGEAHPATGMAMHQLAEVQIALQKVEAAIPLKQQAATILARHCDELKGATLRDTVPVDLTQCTRANLDATAFETTQKMTLNSNN